MMSRDSSPPPLSDDSAVGSMASAATQNTAINYNESHLRSCASLNSQHAETACFVQRPSQNQSGPNIHRPTQQNSDNDHTPLTHADIGLVKPEELRQAASRMRHNNSTLTSRSIRTNLSCFNDLDIQRFETSPEYLVNFISIGVNKSQHCIHRPVSILWPDTYDKIIDALAKLDAHLINTEYKEKPLDWMISRGLTIVPDCRQCKDKMTLNFDRDSVKWQCQKTPVCQTIYAPVLRPSAFKGFEHVGLMKILFSIYYWATCTQCDLLYGQLRLEPDTLHEIWRSIQNICRVALEKSYPRFRLCNSPETNSEGANASANRQPIEPVDLVSIKLNGNFIVCAKHPRSNCVRLGLLIPKTSQYSFAELTESWFAHGAHIRVCETKFLELGRLRSDLKIDLVTRFQMVTKDKVFNRDSAFGYLVCQLTHLFKDYDSSAVTCESIKLILAELEWRELYGTTPFDAFTKIVEHMATYRSSADCYLEASTTPAALQAVNCQYDTDYIYAEKYFYATLQPVDKNGKVIQRYGQKDNQDDVPAPIVQFRCHLCKVRFESFYFSMHMVAHVEQNRREDEEHEYARTRRIKCKHCFRLFSKREIMHHGILFRADYQNVSFGCRICCIKFGNRGKYLEHMRRLHFEHEMPYRCPTCRFGSSFQRDLYIHFQEEHQLELILLCPFCTRSFTITDASRVDDEMMDEISKNLYNHISQHYLLANCHSCDNCCLTFLDKKSLLKHKMRHHNPLEIFQDDVAVHPFIVTRSEEHFCVQAMPMELFIPNKQPNIPINEASHFAVASSSGIEHSGNSEHRKSSRRNDSSSDDGENDENGVKRDKTKKQKNSRPQKNASGADRFLAGASIRINTKKSPDDLTTEIIIELLSKFKRADCIIPNQSVILHPEGGPMKCLDCEEYYTVDHLVSAISCKPCKYVTYCPRALTKHKLEFHSN